MKERTNIRLDDQARSDARAIAERFNLGSVSAAVRYALRDVARRIENEAGTPGGAPARAKDEAKND